MSNSIWHDRYVELPEDVFANCVRPCVIAVDENKKFIGANYGLRGSIPEIKYWARVDDLIAQADKAEQLEKENEAMREEFEVWHGNYMCIVEDKERLEQAVQYLKRLHIATIEKYNPEEKELAEQTIDYAVEMAIEQQSNN